MLKFKDDLRVFPFEVLLPIYQAKDITISAVYGEATVVDSSPGEGCFRVAV